MGEPKSTKTYEGLFECKYTHYLKKAITVGHLFIVIYAKPIGLRGFSI